jgi:hypothetical protein
LVRAVNFIASIMTSGIEEIPKEGAPLEIKLSYGLRAQAGGGFAISQGIDKANFKVLFTWQRRNEGTEPPIPPEEIEPELGL